MLRPKPTPTPKLKALYDYILSERPDSFNTSAAFYSIIPTQEEDLLNEAIMESETTFKDIDKSFYSMLPFLLIDAIDTYEPPINDKKFILDYIKMALCSLVDELSMELIGIS